MVDKQGLQDQTQTLAPYLHPHSARTMVSSMIDDYNALIASENNGKKRKISEVSTSENNLSKTLKEQVFILTKIQDNLLNFLRQKLDVSDEEISKIREIGNVTLAPVKRNPREIPGIFMEKFSSIIVVGEHGPVHGTSGGVMTFVSTHTVYNARM